MELDVYLTREAGEAWGFEIIGGNDCDIPLTVDKVYPCTAAAKAGLQPGDSVARLCDKLACDLSHDAAVALVENAISCLPVGICRGLYDPVLDDYEPIYEPTERPDSDLQSEPTEVNEITLDTLNDFLDSGVLTDRSLDRSLTESPFVPNTKPYRPFSTEPLDVPTIEDPIILNPNFKDEFRKEEEKKALSSEEEHLLGLLPLEKNVEAKFKLPVSEKYDPDYEKRVTEMLTKIQKGEFTQTKKVTEVTEIQSKEVVPIDINNFETTKEVNKIDFLSKEVKSDVQVQFDEEMRTEIDISKIEQTALDIVDESIERAVSVTEEIKKEVEREMRGELVEESIITTNDEFKVTEINEVSESKHKEKSSEFKSNTKTSQEIAEMTAITNEELTNNTQNEKFVEKNTTAQQNMEEEIIKTENVKSSFKDKRNETTEREGNIYERKETMGTVKREFNQKINQSRQEVSREESKRSETVDCNEESKQKAFLIGLQTIPHIKGFVQSSYHFDLLLRTFFVHLTDVMVALSRFILTQPAKELESTAGKVIKEKLIKDLDDNSEERKEQRTVVREGSKQTQMSKTEHMEVKKELAQHEVTSQSKELVIKEQKAEEHRVKQESNIEIKESLLKEDERKKKSGAEMALMSERKSKELTQKMGAVISEFETKKERLEVEERRRSRSRSQIEEEVMKESDPLEWLEKVDRTSQERTDLRKEFYESKESRKSESKRESRQKTSKSGKQTYIAIVESHVYTNQDAILEDLALEMSETSSVQSAEEVQTALEALETVATESVAITNMSEEKQQAVEVINQALEEIVQGKQEIVTDVKSMEAHSKSVIEESLIKTASEATELKQPFEAKEIKAEQAVSLVADSFKATTTTISLESADEYNETKISQQTVSKLESLASIASETTEVISDSKVEFEAIQLEETKAVITSEESYKQAAIEFEEVALEATTDISIEKVSKHEAVSKKEVLESIAAQSTEVFIDSKTESFECQASETLKAEVTSEETGKTAAISMTDMTLESTKEVTELKMETETVSIKDTEAEVLNIAEISETKTEICKKPAEESAALKIIKYEVTEGESDDISLISEENIKTSLEISNIYESNATSNIQSTQSTFKSIQETVQESEKNQTKLVLRTDLGASTNDENNNTPSPSTVPPTPLTDEYIFQLRIPLPKCERMITLEDETDHEDLNIVKKKLIAHIEANVEDQIIYDPPLPTPPEDKVSSPVYTKPGLRGGAESLFRKEYIREIERKSSLLASAIDQTIKSIEEYKEEVGLENVREEKINGHEEKINGHKEKFNGVEENTKEEGVFEDVVLPGFKPVVFNPEAFQANLYEQVTQATTEIEVKQEPKMYVNESGEPLGTIQGIVDGLEDATVDQEVAKELGKPGITEDKIAELISGESEMLREAHVMGLSRVLKSHMTRPDDSSVDFQKIKPLVDSLKDSEVIKVLNEELKKENEKEKKEQEKKWTTFLQKPKRVPPKAKFGYYGYVEPEVYDEEPYKVKIVKQPKPKVAPDYKPEDFETGPLPWEERALNEPIPSPVPPEDPILIPEDNPEFLEAVDPLPESEVPDLEDTGIPLPPPPPPVLEPELKDPPPEVPEPEPVVQEELVEEQPEVKENGVMDQNTMAEQLVNSVKSMVDPNASLEQQLAQMRAQLAALAQLPCVIQQSLELLTRQLTTLSHQESSHHQVRFEEHVEIQQIEENNQSIEEYQENQEIVQEETQNNQEQNGVTIEEMPNEERKLTAEEYEALKREEEAVLEEQLKNEKMKKEQERARIIDQESRQVKQRAPRVGKPKKVFGPLAPEERPQVLPGGRRWRGPKDAYNEQMIAETLQSQAEIIQGKVMGYESDRLPYDERINFMKFEKPPVNLDHLQQSETYKMIHDIEQMPRKQVELLTSVVAESDYRERCRSVTPKINGNSHP